MGSDVSVPDHCLSFYLYIRNTTTIEQGNSAVGDLTVISFPIV